MTTNKTKLEIWTEAYGEFSAPLQRRLDKMVNDYAKDMGVGLAQEISERSLKGFVGKRYYREYNGKVHQVTQVNNEYLYDGKIYYSLSAIALVITGTKWNGKRFFGVCS
jgi:hypothetical protein